MSANSPNSESFEHQLHVAGATADVDTRENKVSDTAQGTSNADVYLHGDAWVVEYPAQCKAGRRVFIIHSSSEYVCTRTEDKADESAKVQARRRL